MSPAERRLSAEPSFGSDGSQIVSQIVIERLVRRFGRSTALDGITARVAGGRITGLDRKSNV